MDSQTQILNVSPAATEINVLHERAENLAKTSKDYASQAIQLALDIGARLVQQRSICEKGKWVEWQEQNLSFNRAYAHRYIALYERVCGLPDDVPQCETRQIEDSGTACLPVVDTACKPVVYKQKATQLLNDAKSLRQAMVAVGIIPKPNPKDTTENAKLSPTITFVKHIDALVLWLDKRTKNDPVEKWEAQTRALLITNLRPIIDLYKQLVALQDVAKYPVRASQRL